MAWGRKNAMRIEVNGTQGSLAFDFEDMNVLNCSTPPTAPAPPATGGSS